MKPRLLFISRKWPPAVGGMETYSSELCASLEPHFAITRKVLPGRRDGRPPRLFSYAAFILRTAFYCLFRAHQFSHVVIGDLVLFPAALCCRLRAPKQTRVVVVYGLDLVYFRRQGVLPKIYALYFAAFRRCQSIFNAVVAISRYTATLAREAGLESVLVANPSLPQTALTISRESGDVALPVAFASCSTRRIVQFGRLVPRKGAGWFAAEVLPQLGDDVTFFVVGASYDESLLRVLQTSPRTHYLGSQPAPVLAEMIRLADAVVMPNIPSSRGVIEDVEGFGLVAIETSSLGGLLVAARLHGIEDAVRDGITGFLVDPANATAWSRALKGLLAKPDDAKLSHRKQAATSTRKLYSRERMGQDFLRCLDPTR